LIRDTLGDDEVTSAMSCAPLTARHDDSLQHAAQMMLKHHVHHLPITTPEKKLVGLISSLDFVRLAAQSS
jgi:CBS-domain-containing membrane protein